MVLYLHRSPYRNNTILDFMVQTQHIGHVGRHLSAHTSRNTSRKMVGGDGFGDHGACTNHAAISYTHTRTVY